MADGIYYVDSRQPWVTANQGNITPTTTLKSCWAAGPTLLPANYLFVGKKLRLTANIILTTGTAGNSQWAMCYGTGDNPGVQVVTATRAKIASVGPFGVYITGILTCRSVGTSGTVAMHGIVVPDLGAFLSTTDNWVFPSNGTTVVSTIDTTLATSSITFQYSTSAGTDTITTTDITLEAMN